MLTMQEIFSKVVTHLLSQGARSLDKGMCAYRGDNGTKCAVGCLISDDNYAPWFEGSTVGATAIQSALKKEGINVEDFRVCSLLQQLQSIHDSCEPHVWMDRLRTVAETYHLQMPNIQNE